MLHRREQSLEPAEVCKLIRIVLQELDLLQLLPLGIESLLICFVDAYHSLLVHVLEQRDDIVLLFDGGVQQIEGVMNEAPLDLRIQCSITIERRGMVDLQQPGFASLVNEDVEAEDFKTHVVVDVAGLARSVMMIEIRLD